MQHTAAPSGRKRISVKVENFHIEHIRNCLKGIAHSEFTVAPVMSGYRHGRYWSSEHNFQKIGEQVMVRFTTDLEQVKPLIINGFGILASKVLTIQVTDSQH